MTAETPTPNVRKIVSGGQTGVDRGALDAAIELGIAHGGWCPRGRLAEDGSIPSRYELDEWHSPFYRDRTEQNVIDSDATLILSAGRLQGGTLLTWRMAKKHGRPCLVIDLDEDADASAVGRWLIEHGVERLNVAGPRASTAADIDERARTFLHAVFQQ